MYRPKILLADDSITTITLMVTALQTMGCNVETALEGKEVLKKITMRKPSCLVLEVILPGINGYTICRQVRAQDPQHTLPILLIGTKNTSFDRNYALSLGADQYLAKPFTQEEFALIIWNLLPARLRPIQAPPPQKPKIRLENLIPRRHEDLTLLTTRNPFASTPRMDSSTHQLYQVIDGQKNVKTLSAVTGFNTQKIIRLLNTLMKQKQVELYDPEEQKFIISLPDS